MTPDRQCGFTLLEVLVALVVMGFLMAGLSQGVRFGLQAWTSQARLLGARADADAVDRVLRRLIEHADPGRTNVAAQITGGRGALSLVTELSADASLGSPRAVEVAIGVDAARRLTLRWTPYLHATRLQPAPAAEETVLLTGVDHLEIAYWGRAPGSTDAGAASGWRSAWQGPDLPDLIRIALVFPPGDARRWPPIVASPMRVKAG